MTKRLDEAVKRERRIERKRITMARHVAALASASWEKWLKVLNRDLDDINALKGLAVEADRHFYREEIKGG